MNFTVFSINRMKTAVRKLLLLLAFEYEIRIRAQNAVLETYYTVT